MLEQEEQIEIDFVEETEISQVQQLITSQRNVAAIQQKLKQKGFLTCEECGEEIPEDRRAAYPSARTCVPCQTWLDKNFKQ